MIRIVVVAWCIVAALALSLSPVQAAGNSSHTSRAVSWQERDTATYVVSTLNLLRVTGRRPFAAAVEARLQVTHYNVYADQSQRDLYFITLKRADGTVAGALAYQMGWMKPMSASASVDALGIKPAPDKIVQAFRNDPKRYLGSFKSTLPSY